MMRIAIPMGEGQSEVNLRVSVSKSQKLDHDVENHKMQKTERHWDGYA